MLTTIDNLFYAWTRARTSAVLTVVMLTLSSGIAHAQLELENCGSLLINGGEPFDYLNPADQARLKVVHHHHFTPEIEQLKGHNNCGNNRCRLAGDIDFTLRHYPNHHRALVAMVKYHLLGYDKIDRPMGYTPRCYFNRAIRFRPDDSVVRMIFGMYLHKIDQSKEALEQYREAVALAPNSSEAHYNLGLLYADLKMYPPAREHAQKAYELGFPLPGLRSKLERAGQWVDPNEGMHNE